MVIKDTSFLSNAAYIGGGAIYSDGFRDLNIS